MADRMTLPVLPLRDAVLFPGVATPIGAGRPATLRAIEAALKHPDRKVFAVAQKENVDQVSPGVLYTTGTIARISQVQRNLGGVQLVVRSEEHTSELQSPYDLVCRLLLEKKKKQNQIMSCRV